MKTTLYLTIAIFTLLSVRCLQRDNLWDPCNGCHPIDELPVFRSFYQAKIDSIKNISLISILSHDQEIHTQLTKTDSINQLRITNNRAVYDSAAAITNYNTLAEQFNDSLQGDTSTRMKLLFGTLKPEKVTIPSTLALQLRQYDTILQKSRNSCISIFTSANSECPNQIVLQSVPFDSTLAIYNATIQTVSHLSDSIENLAALWNETNRIIDSSIHYYHISDSLTNLYNKSMLFRRLPRETDPVIINQKIIALKPGDTLAIDTSVVQLAKVEFKERGTTTSEWAVIMGNPLTRTLLKTDHVEVGGSAKLAFLNIDFLSSSNDNGVRVIDGSDSIQFINCRFQHNRGRGIEILSSHNTELRNCIIMHNGSENSLAKQLAGDVGPCGIRISASQNIELNNVLIARNAGQGIDIVSSFVIIRSSTIADNQQYGLQYSGGTNQGTVEVSTTLFCYNGEYAIYRQNPLPLLDLFVRSEQGNRFYKNTLGEIDGDEQTVGSNRPYTEADPQFVDREHDDYRIGSNSPLNGTSIGYHHTTTLNKQVQP